MLYSQILTNSRCLLCCRILFLFLETTLNTLYLKGHGNEADFRRFLHKLVRHWSLTLYNSSRSDFGFEFAEIFVRLPIGTDIVKEKRLSDSASRGVADSPTRRVEESLWSGGEYSYSKFSKFIIDLQNFKQLNQPFKGPI